MARKRDRDAGGHPVFWLLLGFLCGVMAMLGGLLLLLNGDPAGESDPASPPPEAAVPFEMPALEGASPPGGPVVLIPPPTVEPATPIQEPVVRPTLPTFRPETPPAATKPAAAPRPAPSASRSNADQVAEDAAASGMTARTR